MAILGISGSGKTTLARRLARAYGLRHVELDALCHLPNWREASNDDFRRDVERATEGDGWVIDGSYHRKIGYLVVERADTVVWLDLPLPLVLVRLTRRAVSDIITKRELFNGNTQSWRAAFFERDSLVAYAIKQHYRRREVYPRKLAEAKAEVVRLRSPKEVERWFTSL